jgi:hypothetical protein
VVRIGCARRLLVCAVCYMLSDILLSIIYTVVYYLLSANCLACCLLSVVAENGLEFGDKLWPSDDEVAPNDGVCGSGI